MAVTRDLQSSNLLANWWCCTSRSCLVWPLLPLLRQIWCGFLLNRCHHTHTRVRARTHAHTHTHSMTNARARAHMLTHTYMHTQLRARTHTHTHARARERARHWNRRKMSAWFPHLQNDPMWWSCDRSRLLFYLIVFRYFSTIYFPSKNVCPKPKTVITHTEDVHELEREYKITKKSQFSSPIRAWLTFYGYPYLKHTHLRPARRHTSVHKNF